MKQIKGETAQKEEVKWEKEMVTNYAIAKTKKLKT